jgi:hypothetical protein
MVVKKYGSAQLFNHGSFLNVLSYKNRPLSNRFFRCRPSFRDDEGVFLPKLSNQMTYHLEGVGEGLFVLNATDRITKVNTHSDSCHRAFVLVDGKHSAKFEPLGPFGLCMQNVS